MGLPDRSSNVFVNGPNTPSIAGGEASLDIQVAILVILVTD